MLRFIYYPQWAYSKVEAKLEAMEQKGFRLKKVYFYWWFSFVKTKPKQVQYIFTYNYLKENAMIEHEYQLRAQYQGSLVASGDIFFVTIYRVTNMAYDLNEIRQFRQSYLKHVLREKILLCLIFLFCGVFGGVCSLLTHVKTAESICFALMTLPSLGFLLWYLYGLRVLAKEAEH